VLGLEVAGSVASVGEGVNDRAPGERVCALVNGGGYAEYAVAPSPQCLPWPRGYDAIQAACLPETYFTVWANLFELGRLKRGERVLIHGGTSGIGVTAIQLARAWGAIPFATAGTPEKVAACVRLGAEAAIDYRTHDFADEIRRLTDGHGVDVVLDMIGAAYFERNLSCLALDGRLVLIAFLGGAIVEKADLSPVLRRRITITGSAMRPRGTAEKGAIAAALRQHVWPLLDAGQCAPVIQATFPLEQVGDAHALMEGGTHIGKIALRMTA
jgi:NADPH2:quinone reductase